MRPDMKGIHQLEAATLMEELIVVNGMLHHGNEEQKKRARKLLKHHYEPIICQHLNHEAIKIAQIELGFNDDALGVPKSESIC